MPSGWRVSGLIKEVIDQVRSLPGYTGMGIYCGGTCAYRDLMEGRLADDMHALYIAGSRDGVKVITAVARGYSILAFEAAGLVIITRLEGRFAPAPKIREDAEEITLNEPLRGLKSREEARIEAAALLRSFNINVL